jgi:Tfp pilus assembly PilM family ATPase
MAQTIGIHLEERRFHLVALEGSPKKHKLSASLSGELPLGEEAGQALGEALRAAAKKHKLRADSVTLAIDSSQAAFRTLTLPFDDRSKIEEVLKFEIESDLPQWDIDQVVADFLVLSSKPGVESTLLVTAVPKEHLARALAPLEKAGLEALEAELEGSALFDAALEAGVLKEDAGTVLVHVGDGSTTVVVADGRRLASMRAIRAGAQPARARAEGPPESAEAPESERESVAEAVPLSVQESGLAARRLEESAQRIRRELARTLSGVRTASEIQTIYLCGQPLPGLSGETLDGISLQPLAIVPGAGERAKELVVAYGAALHGLGAGSLRPRLRREELRFTGKFERVELPLAVLTLLVFTLLFVKFIVYEKQIEWRDEGDLAQGHPGDMQLWLEASNQRMLPDPKNPQAVRLPDPPADILRYAELAASGGDAARTKFEELQRIRALLKDHIRRLQRDLGQVSEIKQPQSALEATTLVMGLLEGLPDVRFGVRSYDAAYQHGQAGRDDYVQIKMDLDFFGADSVEATSHYNDVETAFESQPWCVDFEGKTSKVLPDDKGIYVDGLTILVNVDKAHLQQP